jgi:hypothetical protein
MTKDQPEIKAIRRYKRDYAGDIEPCEDGQWVRYDDVADLTPKWQSMDTAPRDGTWIIGYNKPERGNYVRRHVREIRWNGKSWGPFCTPTGITHWMPLPSCPADESGV